MYEWVYCRCRCQSPVAHSCGLLNHPDSFNRKMFKLNAKFDVDPLLYLLSHFECNGHTVHMITQGHLLLHFPVKLSLLIPVHSSPLSLASGLHQFCANHLHCIYYSWTFSRQISCTGSKISPRTVYICIVT